MPLARKISWKIQNFDVLDSTQDELRRVLLRGSDIAEGFVVVAERQEHGRGRHGRVWESGVGNLYFSFLLMPECGPQFYGRIALGVGLAVARAVREFSEGAVQLKWPNDVLIDGKKCAGILIEGAGDGALMVGVGVNVGSAPEGAARLDDDVRAAAVLQRFCDCFDDVYGVNFEDVRRDWLAIAYPVGAQVSVKIGERHVGGAFEGLDDSGGMIVDGQVITSGDVYVFSD